MNGVDLWMFATRWGNALLLAPTAACIFVSLWARGDRGLASKWIACFAAVALVALATKIAFLGWGIGIRRLDFTGVSGHSTMASAVLPVLGWWCAQHLDPWRRRLAVAAGFLCALVVVLSRVLLDAHSISEAVAGFALGSLVALVIIHDDPRGRESRVLRAVVVCALLCAGLFTGVGESTEAHGWVLRLALLLSGRQEVFTRAML